jgi:hypothetical protein
MASAGSGEWEKRLKTGADDKTVAGANTMTPGVGFADRNDGFCQRQLDVARTDPRDADEVDLPNDASSQAAENQGELRVVVPQGSDWPVRRTGR